MVDSMGGGEIDNCAAPEALRHVYVHIPFCARICPYCAFYKERADPAQATRFCEAILAELDRQTAQFVLRPETIFFGGGTPTALTTTQLELLLGGFRTTTGPLGAARMDGGGESRKRFGTKSEAVAPGRSQSHQPRGAIV